MGQEVMVRSLALGRGAPKLCAPIVGAGSQAVLREARALAGLPVDMAEWRFDKAREALCAPCEGCGGGCGACDLPEAPDTRLLGHLLGELRLALGEMPLLFTYRTAAELGGAGPEPAGRQAGYAAVLRAACQSQCVDMVDIELRWGAEARSLAAEARGAGVRALLSLHDFQGTPPVEDMVAALLRMEDAGADIAKLAVTPRAPGDVLGLLAAMEQARARLQIPFAAMGMGKLGVLTRLGGGLFGSAFTFGAAAAESAPGQPPVEALREALTLLYGP